MATKDSTEIWDKKLEDIQRADQSPSARLTRRSLAGGKTGIDLPQNAYNVITGIYTGPFIELWAASPPADPVLVEALQPVHDAARAFTPYAELEPQIDQFLTAVAAAREVLGDGVKSEPTAEQIIDDMEMWLKINLLVAGTSHLGPLKVIDDEIAKQAEAVRTGFRLPPRHFDFATNDVVNVPTETSLPLAVFAASVDNAIASTWAEALQPDPADQPGIMKQFAAQLIVTFYTEWEEYYRPALARALDCEPEALRLDYFGDIRNMRQDYVHTRGFCRNSVKNKVLKWFTKRQAMIPTPENYLELLTEFPSEALKVKPPEFVRDRLPVGANAKADMIVEFDRAVAASGITKDAALDQALAAWISGQSDAGSGS
ncbi:hypothetical protein QWI29_25585 [Mycolicibacterium neoaurum]|uniref:hypothetical protein n=1 Tax=Mycolicibacterium neoaurum TaxID=1795 RepID=UPI002671FCEA|nr:hypothetical protein [Mycolicibacterium neoaurum]MDO3403431.1 hypothetical protein [Mycolicibacterium neoaurum]